MRKRLKRQDQSAQRQSRNQGDAGLPDDAPPAEPEPGSPLYPQYAERRAAAYQRREAFRVGMRMAVLVDRPMELTCELVDISFLGARFSVELPCTPGIVISFRLEVPTYGATSKPTVIPLRAEVVRVEGGQTGVRFIDLSPEMSRTIKELVLAQERRLLAATSDRRKLVD
jgi:hypothetical protein